jgi:hypothetical protein
VALVFGRVGWEMMRIEVRFLLLLVELMLSLLHELEELVSHCSKFYSAQYISKNRWFMGVAMIVRMISV